MYKLCTPKKIFFGSVIIILSVFVFCQIINYQKTYVQLVVYSLQKMEDALMEDDFDDFAEAINCLQTVSSAYGRKDGQDAANKICTILKTGIYKEFLDADKEALAIVLENYVGYISEKLIIKKEMRHLSERFEVIFDNYLTDETRTY